VTDKTITPELVTHIREAIGPEGVRCFQLYKRDYGEVGPVIPPEVGRPEELSLGRGFGIPHAVHFREGMQVRNMMRQSGLCDDWDDHDLDNNWAAVIEEAIKDS